MIELYSTPIPLLNPERYSFTISLCLSWKKKTVHGHHNDCRGDSEWTDSLICVTITDFSSN